MCHLINMICGFHQNVGTLMSVKAQPNGNCYLLPPLDIALFVDLVLVLTCRHVHTYTYTAADIIPTYQQQQLPYTLHDMRNIFHQEPISYYGYQRKRIYHIGTTFGSNFNLVNLNEIKIIANEIELICQTKCVLSNFFKYTNSSSPPLCHACMYLR